MSLVFDGKGHPRNPGEEGADQELQRLLQRGLSGAGHHPGRRLIRYLAPGWTPPGPGVLHHLEDRVLLPP